MRNFRINTVAAGTDIDASAATEGAAIRWNRTINTVRPADKRQACKGKKRMTRPEPGKCFTYSTYKPVPPKTGKGLAKLLGDGPTANKAA